MSDGVRVAGDPAATVHAERDRGGEPRPEDTDDTCASTPRPKVTFTPGQRVELAVQVGSWPEGTSGEIVDRCAEGSAYEWNVHVHREIGPVRVGLYEHELRPAQPSPSLIERLAARTSDEWLVGYKDWELKAPPAYPWDAVGFPQPDENGVVTFPIINNRADGEAASEDLGVLAEAENLVLGARAESYGSALDNWHRTAKLWEPILGVEVTAEQAALCMVQMKVARLCSRGEYTWHRDSVVDGAGYFAVVAKIQHDRERE